MRVDMKPTGKTAVQNFKQTAGTLLAMLAIASTAVQAAQVLTPIRVGGSNSGADISTVPAPLNAGTTLFFDVNYSVTGSQTQDEAGIGLKIQYDSSKFDPVITYDGLGAVTSTQVSNLLTKCMIASPSDQLVSGTAREVVFGWIDTSIRATPVLGAVGWPGTADPAAAGAANGCLNPGSIVTTSAGFVPPTTLFRIGLKSKPTFNGGAGQVSSNIVVTTAGNISYAAAGNVDTNKIIVVNAAPAPLATLTQVLSRKVHSTTAAATSPTFDFVLWDSASGAAPTSIASAAVVKTEPRNPVNAGAVGTAGHLIAFKYTASVSGSPIVSSSSGTVASVTTVGDEVRVLLTGVTDISRVLVTVNGVGDDKAVAMGFLAGNVNSFTTFNMATNSTDIGQVKGQSGVPSLTATNFVFDVNASGAINSTDIGIVKGKSGNVLP